MKEYTATVSGIKWAYTVSDGKASIYNLGASAIPKTTAGAITIPSKLGGYPVTSIGDYAFFCCRGLTSVTIPEGVTSIGYDAFLGCWGLRSVTIPSSVTKIGAHAFGDCSSLTSVTIPEGVTKIGNNAFCGCSGLTSVVIPSSVTWIDEEAFWGCSGLTSVVISEGVKSIGRNAFFDCSGLTSVTIPSSVKSIGDSAFRYCSRLTSVVIPSSVKSIGSYVFSGCSGLTSVTFKGVPPMVWISAFSDVASGCKGYYPSTKAEEWEAEIGDGKWCGLTMEEVSISEIPTFTVNVTVVGDGQVSGTGKYEAGAEVSLTAVPGEGMVFCGWSTTPLTASATYTFTMPEKAVHLTAYFMPAMVVESYIRGNNLND